MVSSYTKWIYYKSKRKEIGQEILQSTNYKPTRIRKTIKQIITVAMPISISSLISSFNKNIDSFTIVRFLKQNMDAEKAKVQYGILSGKIDSLCALPFSLNSAFVSVLVPNISKTMARGNANDVGKKATMFILISILVGFPITAIMFIFSKQILSLLFPNAQSGAMYLRINSIAIIFMLLAQTLSGLLQGIGEVKIPPIAFGIGMITKFICNIILISKKEIGIYGAIIGNILCNVIAFVIQIIILSKNLKLKFELKKNQFWQQLV